MRFASLFLTPRWAAAVVAVLAGGWLGPAYVQAGCGDYVSIPGQNHPQHENDKPSVPDRPQPFPRCTGVSCLPPADMTLAGSTNSFGEVDPLAPANEDGWRLHVPEHFFAIALDFHEIQRPLPSIFHPPRA
jgi:hypothetical protein